MDKGKTIRPMKVRLYYSKTDETNCMSNILWDGKFPMSPKGFPSNHPVRIDGGTAFKKFREKYWASCFPEGDGIAFNPHKHGRSVVVSDIKAIFGWEVE